MNWQIFFSTFLLIFLAELGDKTQLAVLAQSAGSSSRWTVFFAGSLALVFSTAVGVLAGSTLRKIVPDMNIVRACGGVMFLIFGVLMLVDVVRARKEEPISKEVSVSLDWMSRHVIQHAAAFEAAAASKYKLLAAKEINKEKRELYNWLVQEEEDHFRAMKAGMVVSQDEDFIPMTKAIADEMPPIKRMLMENDDTARSSRDEILEAIDGEEAMVQFYEALARHCKIPRLKDTFHALAAAEQLHADKLKTVLDDSLYGRVD